MGLEPPTLAEAAGDGKLRACDAVNHEICRSGIDEAMSLQIARLAIIASRIATFNTISLFKASNLMTVLRIASEETCNDY